MRKITILVYNVNRTKTPFVTIGMIYGDTFELPIIELDEDIPYEESVIQLSEEYLQTMLSSYLNVEVTFIEEIHEDENLLLIFEVDMNHMNSYIVTSVTKVWFATLHEIVNTNNFCNISFSENSIDVVKKYLDYFSDFAAPTIKYDGSYTKKITFESLFGTSKRDENDGKGNIFRYYDFCEAYKRAKETNKSSAVLRYAIFSEEVTDDDFLPLTLHPLPLKPADYLLL